jgi:CRISPR-associated endonuclease Cas2
METKRGEAVKTIMAALLTAGAIAVAATSPMFGQVLAREMIKSYRRRSFNAKERKKYSNAFYYLKRKGLIDVEYRGNQMYFSLSAEGKKKASKYKIDELKIKKSQKWDRKWHVLIFDIEDKHKIKREALRGKLKQLGLYQLQKSVWVCPYEFKKEMQLLRDFFGLESKEMKVINAFEIEDDTSLRKFFNL